MIQTIKDLHMKRREIISDGYDEALEYLSRKLPLVIHKYPTGMELGTWYIPDKWVFEEAFIADSKGNILFHTKDNPMYVMSYSDPVNKNVSKKELLEHIKTNPKKPTELSWSYSYYKSGWGFSLKHNDLKKLKDTQYKVVIKSGFTKGYLKVGECFIKGKSKETILLVSHLCHPFQANDALSGLAVMVDIAKDLLKRNNHYSYKVLFVPETIGSIAYLSDNMDFENFKYGIFFEMLGAKNTMALQYSRQGDTVLDKIAKYVMKDYLKKFREGPYRKIIGNDEIVFNGPGVDIPMISLSRFPYKEYHTDKDNLDAVSEENLLESKKVIKEIIYILDNDFTPIRRFRGPLRFSKYGLWERWNMNNWPDYYFAEDAMLNLEGDLSVFEIAEKLNQDFYKTHNLIKELEINKLIIRGD